MNCIIKIFHQRFPFLVFFQCFGDKEENMKTCTAAINLSLAIKFETRIKFRAKALKIESDVRYLGTRIDDNRSFT